MSENESENKKPSGPVKVSRIIFYDLLTPPNSIKNNRGIVKGQHLSIPIGNEGIGVSSIWAPNGYGKTFAMKLIQKIYSPRESNKRTHWLYDFLESAWEIANQRHDEEYKSLSFASTKSSTHSKRDYVMPFSSMAVEFNDGEILMVNPVWDLISYAGLESLRIQIRPSTAEIFEITDVDDNWLDDELQYLFFEDYSSPSIRLKGSSLSPDDIQIDPESLRKEDMKQSEKLMQFKSEFGKSEFTESVQGYLLFRGHGVMGQSKEVIEYLKEKGVWEIIIRFAYMREGFSKSIDIELESVSENDLGYNVPIWFTQLIHLPTFEIEREGFKDLNAKLKFQGKIDALRKLRFIYAEIPEICKREFNGTKDMTLVLIQDLLREVYSKNQSIGNKNINKAFKEIKELLTHHSYSLEEKTEMLKKELFNTFGTKIDEHEDYFTYLNKSILERTSDFDNVKNLQFLNKYRKEERDGWWNDLIKSLNEVLSEDDDKHPQHWGVSVDNRFSTREPLRFLTSHRIKLFPNQLSFGQRSLIAQKALLHSLSAWKFSGGDEDVQLCVVIDEPEAGRSEYWIDKLIEDIDEAESALSEEGASSRKSLMIMSHREYLLRNIGDGKYSILHPIDYSVSEEE